MTHYELLICGGATYRQDIVAASYEVEDQYDEKWTTIKFENDDGAGGAEARVAAGHSYSIVVAR